MRAHLLAVGIAASMALFAAPAGAGGRDGGFFGAGTFFGNVSDSAAATQVFRFYNGSRFAGTARMVLYDAATGAMIATWTSASIPSGGAVEVSAATIASAATPALTPAQRSAAFNANATASFRGTVRQITRTTGAVINQTDCGTPVGVLSYVEGPGFPGVTAAVKLLNPGFRAGTVTLSLRNAATGAELGRWTSPTVQPHGSTIVSVNSMAAAATPVVPASTTALTIVPVAATTGLGLEHLAAVTASGAVANLTDACPV